MELLEYLWSYSNIYGVTRISMDIYGVTRISMELLEYLWSYSNIYGVTRISMELLEYLWISMELLEYLWSYSNIYGDGYNLYSSYLLLNNSVLEIWRNLILRLGLVGRK